MILMHDHPYVEGLGTDHLFLFFIISRDFGSSLNWSVIGENGRSKRRPFQLKASNWTVHFFEIILGFLIMTSVSSLLNSPVPEL